MGLLQEPCKLLSSQLDSLKSDLDELTEVLRSPKMPQPYRDRFPGLFGLVMNPLRSDIDATERKVRESIVGIRDAWKELERLKRQNYYLMENAQASLGGVVIRQQGLDRGMASKGQQLLEALAEQTGISWAPVVIIGQETTDDWEEEVMVKQDAGDTLVRLPIPAWEPWYLPLLAHDYGFWLAKDRNRTLYEIGNEQAKLGRQFMEGTQLTESQSALLLPEIRSFKQDIGVDVIASDADQKAAELDILTSRQLVHTLHIIADAFATYLLGPVYMYPLIFLALEPLDPFSEGKGRTTTGRRRSRYLPSDARRAAIVFHILRKMDEHDTGLFSSELKFLESMWRGTLQVTGLATNYAELFELMRPLADHIFAELNRYFGGSTKAVTIWQQSISFTDILKSGTDLPATTTPLDLPAILGAAWWCRSRYPMLLATLTEDTMNLLAGGGAVKGLNGNPVKVSDGLFLSRLFGLSNHLKQFEDLFNQEAIDKVDQAAVSGRFYRLLSKRKYEYEDLYENAKLASRLESWKALTRQTNGYDMREIEREVLDFLSGILLRQENLDQGISRIADSLINDYARLTGVNWSSRVIPGRSDLFSPVTDLIHHPFPDWSIWSLPILAHEFGHVVALSTLEYQQWHQSLILGAEEGHPGRARWSCQEVSVYIDRRLKQIDELFADAFAVYCQGPSFAYNTILLYFNPAEAYKSWDYYPTYAERVEGILTVLRAMNRQEQNDEYSGPYDSVIARLESWWRESVERAEAQPNDENDFHIRQARELATQIYAEILHPYFRLGARYPVDVWKRVEDVGSDNLVDAVDLHKHNLRNLLNLAWACLVQEPSRKDYIAKQVLTAYQGSLR